MRDIDALIQNNFKIRYCYKYKGVSYDLCECGKPRICHEESPNVEETWSYENNTKLKNCDSYGSVKFTGYDNVSEDHKAKFIRFDYDVESVNLHILYNLLTNFWKFPRPKLIISINGGYKRMAFKNSQQKKNFKQGLIEVMKKDDTWIIGGGFNVGIQKLISEAVYEFRLHHDDKENKVTLIGIGTWGVVRNKECLLNKDNDGNYTYPNSNLVENKRVTLDAYYDCFIFCDDGTESQYGKEMKFRLNFEKFTQNQVEAYAVQILYEGGRQAIENSYLSLKQKMPLVVIKGSGRGADIINDVLGFPESTYRSDINNILENSKDDLKINTEDMKKLQGYLYDIYSKYRKYIFIHDFNTTKLDKKILEAIISSQTCNDLDDSLGLLIRFNQYDIAETKVFQDEKFSKLRPNDLNKHFLEVLKLNQSEFVEKFLENNFDINGFLKEEKLIQLYQNSMRNSSCQCSKLLNDLISNVDKSYHSSMVEDKLLNIVYKIVCDLSGNILEKKNYTKQKLSYSRGKAKHSNISGRRSQRHGSDQCQLTSRDLFLWALLSGYINIAKIFWKVGKDHIASALIATIILNKMKILIFKRGFIDVGEMLGESAKEFQQFAIDLVQEAYKKNLKTTSIILKRSLKQFNNMTCLQIAISGNLLDFLNVSACTSYTREAWMGELSSFLSWWKIILTIPFGPLMIPWVLPVSNKYEKDYGDTTPEANIENPSYVRYGLKTQTDKRFAYFESIRKFYQAPIVKFIVHLVFYILFLFVFAYLNLVELKYLKQRIDIRYKYAEIYVYFNLLGLFAEEIRQVSDQERTGKYHKFKAYISGSWNKLDMAAIFIFLISIIIRLIVCKEHFMIARAFYAITFSMFCIRAMQFYFINPSIGPKVIMIRKMIVDILFFLSIFVLFLISYGTLFQALQSPNTEFSLSLIKDVFYQPYFQTYGELMLDNVVNPNEVCNSTICIFKKTTIVMGFAVFLLLTNVLLINLLIAMFGHTFKKIQGESKKIFYFIQIQLVEEFHEKPLAPPPLNLLYYTIAIFLRVSKIICPTKEKKTSSSFLVVRLTDAEDIKMKRFEELCLESSIIDAQFPQLDNSTLFSYVRPENLSDCTEKKSDFQEYASFKSTRYTSSRLEKLERKIGNLIHN